MGSVWVKGDTCKTPNLHTLILDIRIQEESWMFKMIWSKKVKHV